MKSEVDNKENLQEKVAEMFWMNAIKIVTTIKVGSNKTRIIS